MWREGRRVQHTGSWVVEPRHTDELYTLLHVSLTCIEGNQALDVLFLVAVARR